jgi:hypothetical protein
MADSDTESNEEKRAASLANLKPFQKGQSGNPGGRPRSAILSDAYRRRLAQVDESDPERRTFAEIIAAKMVFRATNGDPVAAREIADRVEGKSRQTITLTMERRDKLERAVESIMREAEEAQQPCTRETAIKTLSLFEPEASALLN